MDNSIVYINFTLILYLPYDNIILFVR